MQKERLIQFKNDVVIRTEITCEDALQLLVSRCHIIYGGCMRDVRYILPKSSEDMIGPGYDNSRETLGPNQK